MEINRNQWVRVQVPGFEPLIHGNCISKIKVFIEWVFLCFLFWMHILIEAYVIVFTFLIGFFLSLTHVFFLAGLLSEFRPLFAPRFGLTLSFGWLLLIGSERIFLKI